jgi:hypothetical protein
MHFSVFQFSAKILFFSSFFFFFYLREILKVTEKKQFSSGIRFPFFCLMWLSNLYDPEDSEAGELNGCEEVNPGEGDPSQVGVVRLVLRRHKYCNMTHQ